MEPKKLTKLLNDAGIVFAHWTDWELVQRELANFRVARDKAESSYCLFLHAVETRSADWRSGLDSKEPQTFDHWLRKNALHEDPARYRAMLSVIDDNGLEWVQRVGPLAAATVAKNLPPELRSEGFARLADKRAEIGQPVSPKTAPSIIQSIKSAHPDVCPSTPKRPEIAKLRDKVHTARVHSHSLENELREARTAITERDRTIARLEIENMELRERLSAAQTALGARATRKPSESHTSPAPAE